MLEFIYLFCFNVSLYFLVRFLKQEVTTSKLYFWNVSRSKFSRYIISTSSTLRHYNNTISKRIRIIAKIRNKTDRADFNFSCGNVAQNLINFAWGFLLCFIIVLNKYQFASFLFNLLGKIFNLFVLGIKKGANLVNNFRINTRQRFFLNIVNNKIYKQQNFSLSLSC